MIVQIAVWWLASTLIGLAAFPAAYRIFGRLSDRGYGLSRAFGLLVSGYVLWLGASIGVLGVDFSSALGSVVVLIAVSAIAGAGRWSEIIQWMRKNLATLLAMEAVFLGAFVLWSFVRANNPDIVATEKPMELAFLNAILRADAFPPPDPWLSGHAISYYYFGYVLLAFLARLTSVASGVAFNLGNALWFALTALGSYSLIYNLLANRSRGSRLALALLGPLFLLLAGNLEGFLEVLHARHVGWTQAADGAMTSTFWSKLEVAQLEDPPVIPEPTWRPDRYLWWWRASRVVRDVNLAGNPIGIQPIDEFPFFSFLLADNHPHLLALPFALIAVGFAMQVFMSGKRGEQFMGPKAFSWRALEKAAFIAGAAISVIVLLRLGISIAAGVGRAEAVAAAARMSLLALAGVILLAIMAFSQIGMLPSGLSRREFWVAAWLFGGLAFLNTWDSPMYFILLLAVLWWTSRDAPHGKLLVRLALTGIGVAVAAVLLYLPWLPTFGSQLGGILPNVAFTTKFPHFLIVFGTSFLPIGVWLGMRVWRGRRRRDALRLLLICLGIVGLLLVASLLVTLLAYLMLQKDPGSLAQVIEGLGISEMPALVKAMLNRRLTGSWTSLVLGLVLGAGTVLLLRRVRDESEHRTPDAGPQPWRFVVMLAAVGAFLILWPEFFYLRDFFNVRVNTLFKFYFAAWILWSLAAAYAATELLPRGWGWVASAGALIVATPQVFYYAETQIEMSRTLVAVYAALWIVWGIGLAVYIRQQWPPKISWLRALYALAVLPVFLGLLYSVQGVLTKTHNLNPYGGMTLDGTAYLEDRSPEEFEAIQWINANLEPGVILEAVGGSYTEYARVSTHTGIPTILGWVFHEQQWRGEQFPKFIGSREEDVQRIYEARNTAEAMALIDFYDIDYVYVGPLEQRTYAFLSESRLTEFLSPIFRNRAVTIFAVVEELAR